MESSRSTSPCSSRETICSSSFNAASNESSSTGTASGLALAAMSCSQIRPPHSADRRTDSIFCQQRPAWRLTAGRDVEGDAHPHIGGLERHRTVPEIRRKQRQLADRRRDDAAGPVVVAEAEARFAEFESALAAFGHFLRQRHVIGGADPALVVDVIGVKAGRAQPAGPRAGEREVLLLA